MSTTHELEYKGRKIKITVSSTSAGHYVGTYGVADTDPYMRGTGADSSSEEGALTNAQSAAIEAVDRLG
jgi:hypothetical protein